jgi:hypothetical protein
LWRHKQRQTKIDLSEWAVEKIPVPGMNGDPQHDAKLAKAALVKKGLFKTIKDVDTWLDDNKLDIHHHSTTEMHFVPRAVHSNVRHQGPATELRKQNKKG